MNEELKEIFQDNIRADDEYIPAAHLRYRGDSRKFIVWTLLSETPELCCDDEPMYSVATVDVDIYSDSNYLEIIKAVKKLMKENGWYWVEDSEEMYEEDTGLYHKTLTFKKEREL